MVIAADLKALKQSLEQKVVQRTKELETRNAKLQKLDQFKSDFVSLFSHELRGPMTTLKGGLELAFQEANNLVPETRRIL